MGPTQDPSDDKARRVGIRGIHRLPVSTAARLAMQLPAQPVHRIECLLGKRREMVDEREARLQELPA